MARDYAEEIDARILHNWCGMGRKAPPSAPATTGRKRKGPSFPPLTGSKRRRAPAPAAAQASGWASLPSDIAHLVGCRVLAGDVVDYIAFRAVCSGWRASTASPRDPTMLDPHLRPRAWVALCDGDAVRPDEAGEITFFHTRTARSLRVRLPELRRYRIVGFTDGLVILLHKRTTAVRVLHPFTRAAVDLPPLAPVYHRVVRNRNSLLDMSAAVCTATSGSSVAVVVWFPWTPGVLSTEPGRLEDGALEYFALPRFGNPNLCSYYLVESGGHMLLVVKHRNTKCNHPEPWKGIAFAIFKVLDVNFLRWLLVHVSNLGDRALFLGEDRCLSISAKDLPSVSSNSLYFSVLLPNHVVLHSLSDQSFERPTTFCQVHDTKERIRPSVRPFTIADHLLTYCSHREWARGLMFHEYNGVPECFEDLQKKIRKQDSQLRIPQ
ncbi:hypothetical protein EJB05_07906, partial [Eragrostis curvula]